MDTQEQDFLRVSSGKDAPTTRSLLDTLAKALADGTISRKQALKLMSAGTAAVASLALAGCGGKNQAKEGASGSGEPSGGSTNNTTGAQKGSTPKQGLGAEKVAAAAKRAMEIIPPEGGPGQGHQGHRGGGDPGDGRVDDRRAR
jgi:hypothetical protein